MKRTFLALLPAILAHIAAFVLAKIKFDEPFVIWILIGMILIGAGISANYVTGYMQRRNENKALSIIIGIIIFVSYSAAFIFTGCLVVLTQAN